MANQEKYIHLINLVDKMRSHQKSYFAHKNGYDLKMSKEYEMQVDRLLALERHYINGPAPVQEKLFE